MYSTLTIASNKATARKSPSGKRRRVQFLQTTTSTPAVTNSSLTAEKMLNGGICIRTSRTCGKEPSRGRGGERRTPKAHSSRCRGGVANRGGTHHGATECTDLRRG